MMGFYLGAGKDDKAEARHKFVVVIDIVVVIDSWWMR
jgi:hypothetical protein